MSRGGGGGGGVDPLGGVERRCRGFSVIMYAKTKELGPVGGRTPEIFVCRSATAKACVRIFGCLESRYQADQSGNKLTILGLN